MAAGDAAVRKTAEQTHVLTDSANIWFSFLGYICVVDSVGVAETQVQISLLTFTWFDQ